MKYNFCVDLSESTLEQRWVEDPCIQAPKVQLSVTSTAPPRTATIEFGSLSSNAAMFNTALLEPSIDLLAKKNYEVP